MLTPPRFRWVTCQLDELQNCVDLPSLRLALRSLPKTLEETYARILATAPPQHLLQTRRILKFLLFSERPLLVEEAVDAVAVELEGSPRFHLENRFLRPETLLDYCSSLVAIKRRKNGNTGDQTVIELQFAHLSIKEYLMSNQLDQHIAKDLEETAARASIAEVCLAYLLELPHSLSTTEIRQSFPLAQYCAQYWASHAAFAESSSESVRTLMVGFFSNQSAYETCYRLYDPERAWKDDGDEDRRGAPALYYASLTGLTYPVQILIENGVDINEQAGKHSNALRAALSRGHMEIVRMLRMKGANIALSQETVQIGPFSDSGYASAPDNLLHHIHNTLDDGFEHNTISGSPERHEDVDPSEWRTVYSATSSVSSSRQEGYISELTDDLLGRIRSEDLDEKIIERMIRALPRLLKAFALKFGFNAESQMHRDVMFFTHIWRKYVFSTLKLGLGQPQY